MLFKNSMIDINDYFYIIMIKINY